MNYLKSAFFISTLLFAFSCSKEDSDPSDDSTEKIEPITLECSSISEPTTLEDRGEGVDYIVPCFIEVREDLTIEPGVTIAFEQEAGLEVYLGSIEAIGTETDSISFTGVNKTPGAWNNIVINSENLNNRLHYCNIEYAGKTDGSAAAIEMDIDTKLELKNSRIAHNKGYGFFVTNKSNIEGYANNTFTDNANYPLHIAANSIRHMDGKESSYQGNLYDEIYVHSNSIYDRGFITGQELHKWVDPGVPFYINELLYVGEDQFGHLRIEEGCRISFGEEFGIYLDEHNSVLEILGTQDNKVILEGRNGSGSWNGVYINTNSTKNTIRHAVIRDGGQSRWGGGFDNPANVTLGSPGQEVNLRLDQVALNNSAGCGITTFHYNGNIDTYVSLIEEEVSFNPDLGTNHCL